MKTKKLAIAWLILLFVMSFAWAKDEASLSKSDITKVERAEKAKVEKVEAEKVEVEKVEAPNLSNKGDVAVEKKVGIVEVKEGEAPIRTPVPELKKVEETEKVETPSLSNKGGVAV
ncbi:MAG: hypothetical protein H8D22_06245, partial [Candidatus Cloacimonetes bacterium]|nr:hypothetical protein [Candidatus Cloacimonadota bacterium]